MSIKENVEKCYALRCTEYDADVAMDLMKTLGDYPSIPMIEATLKIYKAKLQKIISEDLLEDLQEEDIDKFENAFCRVVIKQKVNVKTMDKGLLHKWLIDNGYSDIIKENLMFPKGELTPEIVEFINDTGHSYTMEGIAPAPSVQKVVVDRLAEGEVLPDDSVLSVSYFQYADIKFK